MGGSVGPTDSDDGERVRDLEARLDVVERELARSRTLLHESATERQAQVAELKSARRELDSLRARRSVRVALGVSGIGRRLVAALRSVRGGGRRSGGGAGKGRRGRRPGTGRGRRRGRSGGVFARPSSASVDRGAAGGKALTVAIVGGYAVDGLAAALTSTEWRVSRLGAGARPDLDPALDVVIVGSDAVDIRDIPRDPVGDRMAERGSRALARPALVRRVRHRPRRDGRDRRPRSPTERQGGHGPSGRTRRTQAATVREALRALGVLDALRPAHRASRTGASPSGGATTTSLGHSSARSSDRAIRRASISARPGKARSRRATTSRSTSSVSTRLRR